jgi:tryptophan-rich sensory protein
MKNVHGFAALLLSIALAGGAAAFGGRYATGEWYRHIQKPGFTPPDWIFGPVWTLLYLAMAVAAWLVWQRRTQASVTAPLLVYAAQLLLNALWSWMFFGLHRPGLAFADIVVLDLFILATIILFWRVHAVAGALLVPYLAWVSFAAALNLAIWRLNV